MNSLAHSPYRIRDPIHGNIHVTAAERDLLLHPVMLRLRRIKQLGFSEYVYPGATHNRFGHSLGVMHMATRLFDKLFEGPDSLLDPRDRPRLRQAVRLAALVHDVGHAPLSHMSEVCMPLRSQVLPPSVLAILPPEGRARRASHEDYTAALVMEEDFAATLRELFAQYDVEPLVLLSLLKGDYLNGPEHFRLEGVDFLPVLHQIVSSEVDADRMDYLLRDSLYCGVSYGRYDADWLTDNMKAAAEGDRVYLGMSARNIFSFENFLLSRYHMFINVYCHSLSRAFGRMLQMFLEDEGYTYTSDIHQYLALDDTTLYRRLAGSDNRWAKSLVSALPFVRLLEVTSYDAMQRPWPLEAIRAALDEARLEWFEDRVSNVLSTLYQDGGDALPIYVISEQGEKWLLKDYTTLFERFSKPVEFTRLFVHPRHGRQARALVDRLTLP